MSSETNNPEAVTLGVLITYHNEGALLTECLESLRQGGRLPDEILVYDDASTVRPEPFIPAGMPVRVIRSEENRGPSRGRNVLAEASRAGWIHFHDADDLFAPGWYEAVRGVLEARRPDALFTGVSTFHESDREQHTPIVFGDFSASTDLVQYCLHHSLLPACGTYLRQRVLDIGGYSERFWQSEDHDFHIRLALTRPRFEVLPECLAWQRRHGGNRSLDRVRVWADTVNIFESLRPLVGPDYARDFSDELVHVGRTLYQLHAVDEARRAFALAATIAPPDFSRQPVLYRIFARALGPIWAERIGAGYRWLMPSGLRASLWGGITSRALPG